MRDSFVSRFLKGVFSTGVGTLATILIGFVNVLIAVRYVSTGQFGAYILIQVIVAFFVMFSDMGLNSSVTRFIAGGDTDGTRKVVDTVFSFKSFTAAIAAAVIVICAQPAGRMFDSGPLAAVMHLVALLFVLECFNAYFGAVLQGLHMYRVLAGSQVVLSLLNLAMTAALVVWMGMGIEGLIYARALPLGIAILYQSAALPFKVCPVFSVAAFREVFRFGFPLGLNSVLTFVFTRVDTLIIGAMLSPIGVAYYGVASKLPNSGRQLFQSFRAVYFPSISELFNQGRTADAELTLNRSLRAVGFLTGLATLVAFLFRDGIVVFLFSEQYIESAPVLAVLMLALGIGLVGNVLGTTLVGAGYSRLPVVINIVDATVNVTANILLLPVFGIMGAAYAALLARVATNPVNVLFLIRRGIGVDTYEYLKPLAALLACMAASTLVHEPSVALRLTLVALYVVACSLMSVVTVRDVGVIFRGLRYRPGRVGVPGA